MITKKGPRGIKSSANQERGVLTMYYVGIDISKYKHDCFIQNENGEVIYNTFTFSNNKEGFTLLLERLKFSTLSPFSTLAFRLLAPV